MSASTATPRTRLQEILESEGRRVSWLAAQVGVSRTTISNYAHGLHVPEHRRATIARALGRTVDDVFGEDGS